MPKPLRATVAYRSAPTAYCISRRGHAHAFTSNHCLLPASLFDPHLPRLPVLSSRYISASWELPRTQEYPISTELSAITAPMPVYELLLPLRGHPSSSVSLTAELPTFPLALSAGEARTLIYSAILFVCSLVIPSPSLYGRHPPPLASTPSFPPSIHRRSIIPNLSVWR